MGGNSAETPYNVSGLSLALKRMVEAGPFRKIYIEGEIGNFRIAQSGHVYFNFKDAGAQMPAVMFKTYYDRCRARDRLKDGAKVLVYADVTVYEVRGQCELRVMAARPVGEGELMQRYLELKARLAAEGLFNEARKRPLPFSPRRIALVTSPSGAVVHDMCRVLMRRFPALEIRIYPAVVQGAAAAASLCAGLAWFNAAADGWRADLIVVARGGGSFEDLFCFSDEALVRAVAASAIPVVSAVGHETDFTLCDFAADRRAGTPSIAAEIAVPQLADLRAAVDGAAERLAAGLRRRWESDSLRLDRLSEAMARSLAHAGARLGDRTGHLLARFGACGGRLADAAARRKLRLDGALDRISAALRLALTRAEARLNELAARLRLLSPYAVLDRGYSLTTDAAGRIVRSAAAVRPGDRLSIRVADGTIAAVADGESSVHDRQLNI